MSCVAQERIVCRNMHIYCTHTCDKGWKPLLPRDIKQQLVAATADGHRYNTRHFFFVSCEKKIFNPTPSSFHIWGYIAKVSWKVFFLIGLTVDVVATVRCDVKRIIRTSNCSKETPANDNVLCRNFRNVTIICAKLSWKHFYFLWRLNSRWMNSNQPGRSRKPSPPVPLTSLSSGSGTGPLEHPGRGIRPVAYHTSRGAVANVGKRRRHRACTNSCVDLAIVCGQAVPLVEVGERLGGAPGLQVAGHPDGRPHLAAVQGRTGTQTQQGAVTLGLQEPEERNVGCQQKSSVLA